MTKAFFGEFTRDEVAAAIWTRMKPEAAGRDEHDSFNVQRSRFNLRADA
jgi:hypothetical protein